MKLQENIKRNLCPSLESLKGGTFLLSPPPRINQAGDNSQGGGTHTPVPPVSALVYKYEHICTRADAGEGKGVSHPSNIREDSPPLRIVPD